MPDSQSLSHEQHVVLLSGGLDSTYAAIACLRAGATPRALFVDYGQPYVELERVASRNVAAALGIAYDDAVLPELAREGNTFANRNRRLVLKALGYGDNIWVGTRCPLPLFDKHGDSNYFFMRRLSVELEVAIHMPAMMRTKKRMWRSVREHYARLPGLIYSTEHVHL